MQEQVRKNEKAEKKLLEELKALGKEGQEDNSEKEHMEELMDRFMEYFEAGQDKLPS